MTTPAPDDDSSGEELENDEATLPDDGGRLDPHGEDVDADAAARGAIYALGATLLDEADEETHRSLTDGTVAATVEDALARTDLDVDVPDLVVQEDRKGLSARYNDLFVVGYSEVVDPTDGTVENQGPPVSLYESDYRSEVSWNDVNLDLARAYEYFGLQVDREVRRNHDHARLLLEFMAYLCRREAAVDPDLAAARLDFHDRHLRVMLEGLADALADEPGTEFYGRLATFLDRFSAADVEDLAERTQENATTEARGGDDA